MTYKLDITRRDGQQTRYYDINDYQIKNDIIYLYEKTHSGELDPIGKMSLIEAIRFISVKVEELQENE